MFKVSSLLLLTLLLNIQLCSSAPIPAKVVQSPAVAEEPGAEELPPATEHHSDSIEEKKSVQETLILAAPGEAAPSPKEPPAEEDIPVIAKEPESIFIGDQVTVDDEKAVSNGLATQEPLAAAPRESSEQKTVSAEAVAEASPGETTEDNAAAVAVESESSEHHVESPAPEAPIPVIPLEASKNEATGENAAAEAASEEPILIVTDDSIVVEEELLPLTSEEEISVVLVPAEHETEEAGQVEPAAGETAPQGSVPEDPAVIVPVEPAEQELPQKKQEETVPIILLEAKDEEAPENQANEEKEVAPVILKENVESDLATNEEPLSSTLEEDESVTLFSKELEGQVEPNAEETAAESSVPEEPTVIVPVEPTEQAPAQEEKQETVPIILSEAKDEEAPEEHAKEEEKVVQVVLGEKTEMNLANNEEPLPSTLEEDESVTLLSIELEGQVEPNAEETVPERSVPENTAVIVPVEPAEQELAHEKQEETVPIILSDTKGEEAQEENAKEEEKVVPVVLEENIKEDKSVTLFPIELEGQVEGQPVPGDRASVPEEPAVIVPVKPAEQKPAQEEQQETVPIILSDTKEKEAPEEHAKEEEEVVPTRGCRCFLGENTKINPAINEEPLPNTLEEEESVTIIQKELESEGEPAATKTVLLESAPEDPVVNVPLDTSEAKPELEEQVGGESIPTVSPEQPDEEAPEAHTEAEAAGVPDLIVDEEKEDTEPEPLPSIPEEEESDVHAELDTEVKDEEEAAAGDTDPKKPLVIILVEPTSEEPAPDDPILIIPLEDLEKNNTEGAVVQSDPLLEEEAALGEDATSQENDAGDSEGEIVVTSVSDSPSENETIESSLDQGEEVPVAATEVPVATPEPVTAPVSTATHAQEETIHAPVEGGNGTSIKIHSKDIKSAVKLIEEEPEVLLNRGAFLGAAFFTLVLFITIGVVWTTISKKLR